MDRPTRTLLVLGVSYLAAACRTGGEASRPDFSGTWVLDLSRSTLEIPPPDSSIFVIDHHEPILTAQRTHVLGGVVNTVSTRFSTDSVLAPLQLGGMEIPTREYWDQQTLGLDQAWFQGDVPVTNLVRYTLEDGGQALIADEYMSAGRESHHNVWTFRRR